LIFSSNCEYIIANEANKVFYYDVEEQTYKSFALDSNIQSYTLQDKYFVYFDKQNSLAKFYYPEENKFFQIDIEFIKDYNYDKLAYYDDEVLLLVNDIYSRARIFNINSKEIISELTEANNLNCNALYKVPNKSYVIGNLHNEIFIYDFNKKQLLNRIKLPTEQAIEIPLYVVNDSILYYYDKYTLTMLNFKSNETAKKELDSTKVSSITKIFGNNSCLLINENNYKFYIFDYHTNSSLEINEARSQFINLSIIDKDTLYFYKKTNSTSNSQCAIAYSINFDLNKTDTIYSECIVDTVFNSNFYYLNFMIFNEKGLMFDKAKIYNISNSNLLDSLPKMTFSYSPVIYDQENILLKKSKYSDDDTFLFFYDIKEFKLDSIGRTPFTEYNRKFALRDSASNFKQIFNTLSGEVLLTAKNINQSVTDGAFNISTQTKLDTVLFEISSNFLIISDEGITDEFIFKDTVSIKQRYSPKFQVSKDKNLLFYNVKQTQI